MIAVLAAPMMLLLGGAIDTLQLTNAKATLRAATEGAALAAASLTNIDDIEALADQYVRANLPDGEPWDSVDIEILTADVATNSRRIEIMASVDMAATFLRLAGIETTRISASSFATQSAENIEIALVLDISSSMRGQRLDNLQTAASDFVDQMLEGRLAETVSISLVPFGGSVNVGSLFSSYVVRKNRAYVDPAPNFYSQGPRIPLYPYRFTDGRKCLELHQSDYSDKVLPLRLRSQLPHFWRWTKFNPWCPENSSSVLLNSNNASQLKRKISQFTLSDGTGMDVGAAWGMKFLSPKWRGLLGGNFSRRPSDYNDEGTIKVMVVMSDGNITGQIRPKDYSFYSYAGSHNGTNNEQFITQGGDADTPASTYVASGLFKNVCNQMRDNGIKVFTIGFQVATDSTADKLLSRCVANGGSYYQVESLDIGTAFRAIISSLSNLRVTG